VSPAGSNRYHELDDNIRQDIRHLDRCKRQQGDIPYIPDRNTEDKVPDSRLNQQFRYRDLLDQLY